MEYDKEADAAYIYFEDKERKAFRTVRIENNVVLDFDEEGRVLGVEILNASKMLTKNALSSALVN